MWFIGKILLGFVLFFYLILVWFSTFYITYKEICPEIRTRQVMKSRELDFEYVEVDDCQKYTLYQVYSAGDMTFSTFISRSLSMQKRSIDAIRVAAEEGKIHIDFIEEHFDYQGL